MLWLINTSNLILSYLILTHQLISSYQQVLRLDVPMYDIDRVKVLDCCPEVVQHPTGVPFCVLRGADDGLEQVTALTGQNGSIGTWKIIWYQDSSSSIQGDMPNCINLMKYENISERFHALKTTEQPTVKTNPRQPILNVGYLCFCDMSWHANANISVDRNISVCFAYWEEY